MTITAEMILADRKARKMSRNSYAQLVGMTPTVLHNLEHGRKFKPGEEEQLAPFVLHDGPPALAPPDTDSNGAAHDLGAPALEAASSLTQGPVVLLDEEEIEEDGEDVDLPAAEAATAVEEEAPAPGFPGPARYDFTIPGYHISNSELSTFKRCKRKWWLAYYRELRFKQPSLTGVRALGTRLHLALSAYYSTRREDPMEVLEATIAEDRRVLSEGTDVDALTNLEKDAELARAMLEGYMEWLRETGADEGLQILGDEVVVEAPFPAQEGVVLVGKMDVRLRRTYDGARLFMDHKSVGSLIAPTKTLHLDEQMLHYHLLEMLEFMKHGEDPTEAEHAHGGLYNMLRRVKRTPTAKPPFFDRLEVRHNIHELRSYYMRVWGEVVDILELRRKLDAGQDHRAVAYPTPNATCSWSCDFLPVCPMFDDGSAAEEMLAEFYEVHDVHDHYYPHGEREAERDDA